MNLKQQTVDTYNASAEQMAKKFNDLGGRGDDISRGFSYLAKDNPSVLEIGCGNGRDSLEILKYTNDYLGVDISKAMIEVARRTSPKASFEVADIESFKFPPSIDIIFAFASLLHSDSDNLKKILNRANDSLSPNGVFYISLKYGEGNRTITDEFGVRTFFFYKPEYIKDLAGENYEAVWEDLQELRGQKWFTIVLKKK